MTKNMFLNMPTGYGKSTVFTCAIQLCSILKVFSCVHHRRYMLDVYILHAGKVAREMPVHATGKDSTLEEKIFHC